MNKKPLILHIGAPKTGSTTIQNFCSQNDSVLLKKGILYPKLDQRADNCHHSFAWSCWNLPANDSPVYVRQARQHIRQNMKRLFSEIKRPHVKRVLISSEIFFDVGRINIDMLRAFVERFSDVKVIVFLRRWDEMMVSTINQWIKGCRVPKNVEQAFVSRRLQVSQMGANLNAWSDLVGKTNITVRIHSKDVLPEFLSCLNVKLDESFDLPEPVNQSISPALIALKLQMNKVFPDLCDEYKDHSRGPEEALLRDVLNPYYKLISGNHSRHSLLSPQQRIDFLKEHEAMSQAIARKFLGREDGVLFDTPWPDPNEDWTPYKGISHEELVGIVAAMTLDYAASKRKNQHLKHELSQLKHHLRPYLLSVNVLRKLKAKIRSFSRMLRL